MRNLIYKSFYITLQVVWLVSKNSGVCSQLHISILLVKVDIRNVTNKSGILLFLGINNAQEIDQAG